MLRHQDVEVSANESAPKRYADTVQYSRSIISALLNFPHHLPKPMDLRAGGELIVQKSTLVRLEKTGINS